MLRFVVASADAAGKPVSLCGEMGADPELLPLLVGLGLRRISVSPRALPALRERLSKVDSRRAAEVAAKCCDARSSAEVARFLDAGQA
jgi:phosphoenolpyruvate-protein kinase (PTS system EI component)